jgi:predicted MFS family arabinose efflux permease
MGESTIGILMGLNGIVVAGFELVLVRYFEKRKPNTSTYIAAGVALTAIGYLLLILPGNFPLISGASCVLLITAGEMLAMPFIGSFVLQRAREHNIGKYSGAYALSWSIARIAGPAIGSIIVERYSFITLWIVLIVICVACSLLFYNFNRKPATSILAAH